MNTQIAARNVANDLQAQARNAQAQNLRNQAEYEKKINAYSALGNIGGQFGRDALSYKYKKGEARAGQIGGEFSRYEFAEALGKRPRYRKMLKDAGIDPNDSRTLRAIAANMWDPNLSMQEQDQRVLDFITANKDQVEPTAKAGGRKYTKKTGKVRRKNRK